MAKKHNTYRSASAAQSPYDECRDELFQHIMRCGVVGSLPEHQEEWFAETLKYLEDRYPELSKEQLAELRTLGLRFAQPPKKQSSVNAASAA